jgi:hypothetical protein
MVDVGEGGDTNMSAMVNRESLSARSNVGDFSQLTATNLAGLNARRGSSGSCGAMRSVRRAGSGNENGHGLVMGWYAAQSATCQWCGHTQCKQQVRRGQ